MVRGAIVPGGGGGVNLDRIGVEPILKASRFTQCYLLTVTLTTEFFLMISAAATLRDGQIGSHTWFTWSIHSISL